MSQMLYDVIIVGAGPGGSSAAIFLARQGYSVLLLDKARFPRDKVCGDGLTPQSIYWLDILGCVDEVLEQTNSCITECDLFINGEHILSGRFPPDGPYPHFATCLERKILDNILVNKAVSHGAYFKPECRAQKIRRYEDCIEVEAVSSKGIVRFAGKILIGADGANSVISRAIGNVNRDGVTAVSVRAYFKDAKINGSPVKIYFEESFFPGYAWIFVDNAGKANVGLGYAYDKRFPLRFDLKKTFREFVHSDLHSMLNGATQMGPLAGWWSCFFKPKKMVEDRVMLIGDAANLADPMNGGGIHKAMESAYTAVQVVEQALASGDYTRDMLSTYQKLWSDKSDLDWRTGELLLSIAKNPQFREFYILLLRSLSRLIKEDQRFMDFCSGVFCGLIPQHFCFSPLILLDVLPLNPKAWFSIFRESEGRKVQFQSEFASLLVRDVPKMAGRVIKDPLTNIDWGMEVFTKMIDLLGEYVKSSELSLV